MIKDLRRPSHHTSNVVIEASLLDMYLSVCNEMVLHFLTRLFSKKSPCISYLNTVGHRIVTCTSLSRLDPRSGTAKIPKGLEFCVGGSSTPECRCTHAGSARFTLCPSTLRTPHPAHRTVAATFLMTCHLCAVGFLCTLSIYF